MKKLLFILALSFCSTLLTGQNIDSLKVGESIEVKTLEKFRFQISANPNNWGVGFKFFTTIGEGGGNILFSSKGGTRLFDSYIPLKNGKIGEVSVGFILESWKPDSVETTIGGIGPRYNQKLVSKEKIKISLSARPLIGISSKTIENRLIESETIFNLAGALDVEFKPFSRSKRVEGKKKSITYFDLSPEGAKEADRHPFQRQRVERLSEVIVGLNVRGSLYSPVLITAYASYKFRTSKVRLTRMRQDE